MKRDKCVYSLEINTYVYIYSYSFGYICITPQFIYTHVNVSLIIARDVILKKYKTVAGGEQDCLRLR